MVGWVHCAVEVVMLSDSNATVTCVCKNAVAKCQDAYCHFLSHQFFTKVENKPLRIGLHSCGTLFVFSADASSLQAFSNHAYR